MTTSVHDAVSPLPGAGAARAAFTLLEVVVALLVLGVLAAITVPTFNRVKENSVRRVVQATLETIDRNGESIARSDPGLLDAQVAELAIADLDAPQGVQVERAGAEVSVVYVNGSSEASGTVTFSGGIGTIVDAVVEPSIGSPGSPGSSLPPLAPYAVGDLGPAGGVVFYVDAAGFPCGADLTETCTYLEASPPTTGIERTWASGDNQSVEVTGADGVVIGTGLRNSHAVALQSGNDAEGSAALYALAYTVNGYSDWFLPAKDELNELYVRRALVGGFDQASYWSSSEYNDYDAWSRHFNAGYHSYDSKASVTGFGVRPIRAG